jgi:spermidine synthase
MENRWLHNLQRHVLLIALFFTAFSSLIYELIWRRELSYVFGSTAYATSSVLAVFMAGLALGSLYAGKILESRKRPFRFLAQLLCAIGICCILTLFVIKVVYGLQTYLFAPLGDQATFSVKVILFLLTSCVLIAPTFMIGVAFPCIVQLYHARHDLVGQSVSRCYWIDTLGASLGLLLAAFWLAPALGFFQTSLLASVFNVLTGILIFVIFRKEEALVQRPAVETAAPLEEPKRSLNIKIIWFLFFLSGFAALVLEVIWIRHWALIYGSGLHAFALVVVTFLLGLSIGSFLYDRFFKNIKNQIVLFSGIELCIGATAIIFTALFPHMEHLFLKIYYGVDHYYAFFTAMGLICFSLLLIPTTLMGMTLPTLSAIYVSERHIGKDFGKLYAVNSLGALIGSFCAGFIIIPALGIYHSSFLAAVVYIFIAFSFLYCFSESRTVSLNAVAVFVGIIILTAVLYTGLRIPNHLYNGVFYTGTIYSKQNYQLFFARKETALRYLRFLRNGVYGQVSVTGPSDSLLLRTNGKVDSGTTRDLVSYQSFLGHVPMILHEKPSRALNIGLGCGWTVGATVMHPDLESVDSVEINPLIVEVNRSVFHNYNGDIINHPKVHSIINDGRNYISHTNKRYDVVISEPTDLSSSGISALITREFYQSAFQVLNEDGIMCQWFPRYEVTEWGYKVALKTMKDIFPYIYEFDMSQIVRDTYYRSFLIIASKKPIDIKERLKERIRQMESEPNKYQYDFKPFIGLIEKTFHRNNEALENYIADVEVLNTDDLPILEFHALKNRFKKFRKD